MFIVHLSPSGGMSHAPAVRKDVTLSSLYFPEADKQTSSTGQLWYTAWCPLLQVRGGKGRQRGGVEGRGGRGAGWREGEAEGEEGV